MPKKPPEIFTMPRFRQTTEILKLMRKKEAIRNIGIIAHIDHGKTTLTDSLLAEAGLLPSQIAGLARALDYLEEEQKRGITIKTANISLLHKKDGNSYVINLVDTPGHVDFTGKVARALRAIDGAVVVVDAVEEVMAQTETVTRQALEERVKPVLFINKIDRLIKEMKLSAGEIQRKLHRIIGEFNNLIEIYAEPEFKDEWKVKPQKGNVAFGSALHRWGLTLELSEQSGIKFGDILSFYREDRHEELARLIPLHDVILDMVVKKIPDPAAAQKYRIPKIWRGYLDSEIGRSMIKCDDGGPVVMCITNVQTDVNAGLILIGRLFSGTLKNGDRVYLVNMGKECTIQQVSIYMGAFREAVDQVTAGNIVALTGIAMAKAGETVVDVNYKENMPPFEGIKYISEPVMTISIEPKNPKDLPRLVEAMNRLSTEDPNLIVTIDRDVGQYMLSGMGELHLEIALKFLTQYSGGMEFTASNPIVAYRESVTDDGAVVMAKSLNKQNSFWMQVQPLENKVVELIEVGEISMEMDERRICDVLQSKARLAEAKNILAVNKYGNILVNSTTGVQNLCEVNGDIISGFHWACRSGPLCGEPLRGVKVKLMDAQIHESPEQRESSQIMRAVSRAILGSTLTAKPILLEPMYKIELSVQSPWLGVSLGIITRRRGKIQKVENRGTLTMIVGQIPVAETFGLPAEMRSATSGRAFWQCSFHHWEKIPEDIAAETIMKIRERKGLPLQIPKLAKFVDEAYRY
ncbi:MAG: elongation factor EF-2 [Candidatus Bathyarchaeia archaeon]